jgi:type IX secretion system PorP/SprF family membrane protein
MRKFSYVISIVLCTLLSEKINGQQEWGYGQFAMNLFDSNLAYAGQHETASFGLRHRQQWTGITGGPKSTFGSVHMPLAENKIGVGLRLFNESIGARVESMILLGFAYRLRLKHATINFALGSGVSRSGINWESVSVRDSDDPQTTQWRNDRWAPNFNAAVFYSKKNFYAGLEANHLGRYNFPNLSYQQKIHLKSLAGFHQKVGKDDQLQSAALMRWVETGQLQWEANLMYLKNNRIGVGAGYRWKFGAIVLAQFHFSETLRAGINYDFSTQATQHAYDGSFELFLGYTVKRDTNKSIRYL